MNLSNEDNLRLNVLLTQDLLAIRIDESAMVVHSLTGKGEAKVALVPNCRDDVYLRQVRELFSTHALGSPGGYPIFLKRWARMGQAREENLDRLLLLAEPEAVIAVAHAQFISEDLARWTWWAMPTADIARKLLESEAVVKSEFGKELAAYLLEYMPFETEASAIIENIRLVLQAGLVSDEVKMELWERANRKTMYYVGFLHTDPELLPVESNENPVLKQINAVIDASAVEKNTYASMLIQLSSAPGQTFLKTLEKALVKLVNQDMTVSLLKANEAYFSSIQVGGSQNIRDVEKLVLVAEERLKSDEKLSGLLQQLPQLCDKLSAMLQLSLYAEAIIIPVFSQTDAIGSVMRKKLKHITDPMLDAVKTLQQ